MTGHHEVAVAALIRDDRVLLAHRHTRRSWYPDCWDLVGGHLEPAESPAAAIDRECREELGILVLQRRPVEIALSDPDCIAHAFVVERWDGVPKNSAPDEHDAIGWFAVHELAALTLADPAYLDWIPRLLTASPHDRG